MTIETGTRGVDISADNNGHRTNGDQHNGNGRMGLPEDLRPYIGIIAAMATNESDQPLDTVGRDLNIIGVDLGLQQRLIDQIESARREIEQAKKRLVIKSTSE